MIRGKWALGAAGVAVAALAISGCTSESDEAQESKPVDPAMTAAVAEYQAYVAEQVDEMVAATKVFTDAVRAGDLGAAREAYAPSRVNWERIEPIAGLIETFDGVVDARVDDFESENDPAWTGWHRLEYLLFDQETTDGAAEFADQLDANLAELQAAIPDLQIPPVSVPVGASELIEEVSLGKITGEENRYAKTDLWDIEANLDGSQAALTTLADLLKEADADLLADIEAGFADAYATIEPLRSGDGWQLYCLPADEFPSDRCPTPTLTQEQVDTLQAQTAALSEKTSQVAGALGLE